MLERPILFSGAMVRALLDGSKTQTRRVCKPAQAASLSRVIPVAAPGQDEQRPPFLTPGWFGDEDGDVHFLSPYGVPGDRLWVRETFYCDNAFYPDGVGVGSMWREVDGKRIAVPVDEQRAEMLAEDMYYRADGEPEFEGAEGPTPWRPSIHMPRWASRITLDVTGVRVERLRDIRDADAIAEGIEVGLGGFHVDGGRHFHAASACESYESLWDSLNADRGYGWDTNPWVWCVSF